MISTPRSYKRHMNLKRSEVYGSLVCDSHLSGSIPKLRVFFHIPKEFEDYSMHHCAIESEPSLLKEKLIEFVTPCGQESIFYYNIELDSLKLPFEIHSNLEAIDVVKSLNNRRRHSRYM